MENIQQLAQLVAVKRSDLDRLYGRLEQARKDAAFPGKVASEFVPVKFVPANLGLHDSLGAYEVNGRTFEERVAAPEPDPLDVMRQARQDEIGAAYLEGRSPDLKKHDATIAKIEGARAAIPFIEGQIIELKDVLEDAQYALAAEVSPFFRDKFSAAEKAYNLAVEAMRSALGEMSGVVILASRIESPAGKVHHAKFNAYIEGLRSRGLMVFGGSGPAIPNWLQYRLDLPDADRAVEGMKGELAALGFEI